jgi:hypothetical protein
VSVCVWDGDFFIYFYFLLGGIDFYVVKRTKRIVCSQPLDWILCFYFLFFIIFLLRFDFIFDF